MTVSSVCMLTNLFSPVVSGSSTQCAGLAAALSKHGVDVTVVTAHVRRDVPAYEERDGYRVYRLPALKLPEHGIALNFPWLSVTMTPPNQRTLRQIAARHGVQVLHAHNHMFDMALNALSLRRRTKLPVVVTMHTVISHPNRLYNSILYSLDRFLLRHAVVDRADSVVSPDHNMAGYVSSRFSPRRHTVIPYGLSRPPPPDPAAVSDLQVRYGLSGKRVIVSVGHVHAIRNRVDLIRAVAIAAAKVPDICLLIVGGNFDDAPARLAAQLGISDKVVFAGVQALAAIPNFLALGDVEAHWLNQDEVTWASPGVASLEAMYAGKSVLTVAPENIYGEGVLRNGENIFLVDPSDHAGLADLLTRLVSDPKKARAVGAAARLSCDATFSWGQVVRATISEYDAVIARAAGG